MAYAAHAAVVPRALVQAPALHGPDAEAAIPGPAPEGIGHGLQADHGAGVPQALLDAVPVLVPDVNAVTPFCGILAEIIMQ